MAPEVYSASFERTLATLTLRPLTIGDALTATQTKTIRLHRHYMPLALISTGTGVLAEREPRP